MKTYIVTIGEYSSYQVCAVCSTLERAEYAKRLFDVGPHSHTDILEMEMDELPEHPAGCLGFQVEFSTENGQTDSEGRVIRQEPWMITGNALISEERISFSVWAQDEQHALKIANERRSAWVASGCLIPWTIIFNGLECFSHSRSRNGSPVVGRLSNDRTFRVIQAPTEEIALAIGRRLGPPSPQELAAVSEVLVSGIMGHSHDQHHFFPTSKDRC